MEIDPPNSPVETDQMVSILDTGAFAAKHMPDLGHIVREFQVAHWNVQDWRKLDKELYGPEFDCGGHNWRMLLFPSGNSTVPPVDMVSLYLDCVSPKDAKDGWHVCAQFAVVISNPHDPTFHIVSHTHHRFTAKESNWGFTRFSQLNKLEHPQPGLSRSIIEEGSAVVSVYVRVLEDPTGVLWHNFVNYDSKKETGFVGLKSQGSTSYVNSLLQSLFCIHSFRKAVYQIPTEIECPVESIPFALQRVFYHLQTSDQPVGTTELTKSFGWDSADSSPQHDVQAFNRVLQDSLESRMKGTPAGGAIAKLFSGKVKSFIKCINVNYESYKIEEFHDIQLNIKGMKTLSDAFRDYVAGQMLGGETMYQAGGFGSQEVRKGIIFQSLPPVLHLQLKRYEYDMQLDAMVKIGDRFQYPFEIDLDEFLEETADKSKSWKYKLHGVLVHSGNNQGGNYFAFIKPYPETQWLKFDDDRVTPVMDHEVLEENYGGEMLNGFVPRTQKPVTKAMKRFRDAYMLVYIREVAIDEVLAPLTEEDPPTHLKQGLDEERAQIEDRKKEREGKTPFLTVRVVTDRTYARHEGFDLAVFDEKGLPVSDIPTFRVPMQETYSAFKSRVAQRFCYPENQMRLWTLVNRQNETVRPDTHIPEDDPSLTIEDIQNYMASREYSDLRLYLDFPPGPSMKIRQLDDAGTIMILLKHFDTTRQTAYGAGKINVQRTCKVRDLIPMINERMGWELGKPLKLFEEIKPGMVEPMKPPFTLIQSDIKDGDIICFQVQISEAEVRLLEIQGLYSNPSQFYDFLQNRVMIVFRPKFNELDADHPEFSLVLSKKQNYDAMASKVGERLKHAPIKLRFTTTYDADGAPKSILRRSLNQSINKMIFLSSFTPSRVVVLYEKLHVSIIKLETKRTVKVVWMGAYNEEESTHLFLSSKTSLIYDLAEHMSKRVQLTPMGAGRIRVFEVAGDGRTPQEFVGSEMIGDIIGPDPLQLFAEEIPREELEFGVHDKIVNVFHFDGDVSRAHGAPFKFVVKPGEQFSEMKKRLQYRLGVSGEDLSWFRPALVRNGAPSHVSYLGDNDIFYEKKFTVKDFLGLDHADESGIPRRIVRGIGFGVASEIQEPVELFAEEIPREDSEPGDHENLANVFRFTRDVARMHGILFKFGFNSVRRKRGMQTDDLY